MRKMKDSGVAWIGEIPATWEIKRIKSLQNRSVKDSFVDGDWIESPYIADEGIRYLTTGNVGDGKYKEQGTGYISETTFNELNCKYAYPGDFVIARLNAPYGRSCILPDTKDKYVLAVDIVILRTNEDKRYLCYLSQCSGYQRSVEDMARGTAMKRISRNNLGTVKLPIPSIKEQRCIADCLDKKCFQIDALIANVQEQIEKLKAYKQSLITEVVTKGLDPTVPMMDSGVEWIGKIPEHWIVNKIIRCFGSIGSGTTPKSTEDSLFEGDINWIQSGDINGGTLLKTRFQITEDIINRTSTLKIYHAPFIVIAMYGASIGNLSISQIDACTNQACCVLSDPVEGVLLEYLFYAFKPAKDYLIWKADGGGQPNISQDKVKNLWIPIPPIDEQKIIIKHLDKKSAEIDELIAVKQAKIEKLEQYKRSLIYEYVTGKKEVS